tara:strand:- start:198 stop:644 length:447 start_codon:yes stop_codon:yes gene_type:complete
MALIDHFKILIILYLFLFSVPLAANENNLALDIKKSLISPCCWAGTIYDLDHNPEIELQIEQFVNQQKTKNEILEFYVNIYGERILAIPKAEGFNLMAWIAPIVIGVLGIITIILYFKTPKNISSEVISDIPDVTFDDEIETELRQMD